MSAMECFQKGIQLQQKGLFDPAIEEYNRALEIDPDNPDILINLGAAYLQKGLPERSTQILSRVLKNDPNNPTALFNIGKAYLYREEPQSALAAFERAFENDSEDTDILKSIAQCLAALGRKREAADRLWPALESLVQDGEMLIFLGDLLCDVGRHQDAMEVFRKAVAVLCDSTKPIAGLFKCQMFLGMKDKAMTSLKRALMMEPCNELFHVSMADLLLDGNQPNEALAHLKKALDIIPHSEIIQLKMNELSRRLPILRKKAACGTAARQSPFECEVYDILDELYDGRIRLETALKRLADLRECDTGDLFVAEELANLSFHARHYDISADLYSDILAVEPFEARHRINLAKSMAFKGEIAGAVNLLIKSDREIPGNIDLKLAYIEFLLLTRDFEAALKALHNLEDEYRQDPHARFLEGYVMLRLGDNQAALKSFTKLLDDFPNDEEVAVWLTRCSLISGDMQPAIDAWSKFDDGYESMTEVLCRIEIALATGQNDGIPDLLRKIGEYRPRFFEDHLLFGKAFFFAGEFSSAFKEFETVLKDDPDNAEALAWLSVLFLFRNKQAKFWIFWQKAVESDVLYAIMPPLIMMKSFNFTQCERIKLETAKLIDISGLGITEKRFLNELLRKL